MADDGYERHYTEMIWSLIPGMYRDEDGRAGTAIDPGGRGQLRALVEVMAGQAAVLRRSVDHLWDDQFIDLCEDWAVPYLGDLVATRLVSALDTRARRVDVAKTIYYRRRKGTLRVLEELVADITGWEGVVVEHFRRLGRAWHGLDPLPTRRLGAITGTPPGGTADLRRPLGAARTGGPFDEYAHTADVRRHRGTSGRHGIPKLAFHLYRLDSLPVVSLRPVQAVNNRSFTIDPLGRDQPLFARPDRPVRWDDWRSLQPWQVPAPISCALLNHAEFTLTPEAVATVLGLGFPLTAGAEADLEALRGDTYRSMPELHTALADRPNGAELIDPPVRNSIEAASIVEDCGKWALLDGSIRIEVGGTTIPPEEIVAGDLSAWSAPPPGRSVVVDPVRGRLRFAAAPGASVRADVHLGWVGPVGATGHSRTRLPPPTASISGGGALAAPADGAVAQIDDSLNYGPPADVTVTTSVTIQAADRERPFIRLGADWVFDTGPATDAILVLDGLWIGGGHDLVLRGDFATVRLTRCTFDPGTLGAGDGVGLVVEANVGRLEIDRTVVGPITIDPAAVVGLVAIADTIVEPTDPADPTSVAIDAPRATVQLDRVTSFGEVIARRLWASDSLLTGRGDVADTQSGCFRFSGAPAGSRLPRPYESVTVPNRTLVTSRRYPQPGYGQLRAGVTDDIARGAEDGSEMGAFSSLRQPISLDSLKTKVEEYRPFGTVPLYIFAT